jgi:transcriptional regulator with XRE-family HTH domain
MPLRAPQTKIRTQLAASRAAAGLTQKEMAEAIGIPIATYVRLERGQIKNPRLRWLVNAGFVLDRSLDELLDEEMLEWYPFDNQRQPALGQWINRPEAIARAERFDLEEQTNGRLPI